MGVGEIGEAVKGRRSVSAAAAGRVIGRMDLGFERAAAAVYVIR
jgi:hypothetical protein